MAKATTSTLPDDHPAKAYEDQGLHWTLITPFRPDNTGHGEEQMAAKVKGGTIFRVRRSRFSKVTQLTEPLTDAMVFVPEVK